MSRLFLSGLVSPRRQKQKNTLEMWDCVLTFEELSLWLQREDITVEAGEDHLNESKARLFPTSGGILRSMLCDSKGLHFTSL